MVLKLCISRWIRLRTKIDEIVIYFPLIFEILQSMRSNWHSGFTSKLWSVLLTFLENLRSHSQRVINIVGQASLLVLNWFSFLLKLP